MIADSSNCSVPVPYRIHKISRQTRGAPGITNPAACTLHGILKFDSTESPHLVYNEYVALRLAQAARIPVADGVLTVAGDGLAYASLEVALPGMALPDALPSQLDSIATQYPSEAAALVAFDIWIGNRDRGRNLKASIVTPHLPVFRAFDHGHALLNIEAAPEGSIRRLFGDELILAGHPFFGRIQKKDLDRWVKRIRQIDFDVIQDCCVFGRPFRAVPLSVQTSLFYALNTRSGMLETIIRSNMSKIIP